MVASPTLALSTPSTNSPLDLPPHATELALGLTARTKGPLLAVEVSAAILGGWMQLLSQIQEDDIQAYPIRVSTALLLASLMGACTGYAPHSGSGSSTVKPGSSLPQYH
jgi:hypothetical protein